MFNEHHKKERPILGLLGMGGGISFARSIVGGKITATGGTKTTSGDYTIHTFTPTTPQQLQVTDGADDMDMLIIGGGGGGGPGGGSGWYGGGGGAGGYVEVSGYSITPGTYPLTTGNGGSGPQGSDGANSIWYPTGPTANKITALGGGAGGVGEYPGPHPEAPGHNGGSGGGSGAHYDPTDTSGGEGTQQNQNSSFSNGTLTQYGFDGGLESGGTGDGVGGGGGGAGGAGYNSPGPTDTNGLGGAGRASSIDGSSVTYAGGGPSHPLWDHPAPGARGSGGQGGASNDAAESGQPGCIIVRYLT